MHENLETSTLTIDRRRRVARIGANAVKLTPKAFDVLAYLAAQHERVVSKSELMAAVWTDTHVEESNLTQTVFMVRKALRDVDGHDWIATLPRVGYQFSPPEPPQAGPAAEAASAAALPPPQQRDGRMWILLAGALVAIVIGTAAARYGGKAGVPGSSMGTSPGVEANLLYLEGRAYWNSRTSEGFAKARARFERALTLAPDSPRPYAGLADTYLLQWAFGIIGRDEGLTRARALAQRALELDPNLAEAHTSLSYVLWESYDWAGAEVEVKKALASDPRYATAHHWYGLYLTAMHRYTDAYREFAQARALDPNAPIIATDFARFLRWDRRMDEARSLLEQVRESHPTFIEAHVQLADVYDAEGRPAEALRALRTAVDLGERRPGLLSHLARLEAHNGNFDQALAVLDVLNTLSAKGGHVPSEAMAEARCAVGDAEGAIDAIEQGIREQAEWVANKGIADWCRNVRNRPRWAELEAKIDSLPWSKTPPPVH